MQKLRLAKWTMHNFNKNYELIMDKPVGNGQFILNLLQEL